MAPNGLDGERGASGASGWPQTTALMKSGPTSGLSVSEGGLSEVSDEGASSEIAERYERIAAGFTARVKGCRDEQWSWPTPCPEWTTAALVEHVIGVHRRIQAMLEDSDVGSDVADVELVAAWSDATALMQSALRDRSRASTVVVTPFGEMPFQDLASRVVCSDTLVHTWDLARATGQDEHLDARAVEFAWTLDGTGGGASARVR